MARKLRIQFPGAIYHVMSRGDRREDIFRDDFDRESFLQTLADACAKTAWQVHAFCLMPNHFHLVVETPEPNLVAGMKWLLGTYTARFNRRHKVSGHVFAGRYKSLLVGGAGGYLRTVCDYVHLNPVRAKLLPGDAALRTYRWSSFALFLGPPTQRPAWLRVDRLLGEHGIPQDSVAGRNEFERLLETRRAFDGEEEFQQVRKGWCFGDEKFREELLAQVEGGAGSCHYGAEIQEAGESKAIRIIDEELRRVLWTKAELTLRKKGDPSKIEIARRLRKETAVTLQWIADQLHMGSKTYLSHLLYWLKRREADGSNLSGVALGKPGRVKSSSWATVAKREDQPKKRRAEVRAPEAGLVDRDATIPLTDPVGGGFDTSFD